LRSKGVMSTRPVAGDPRDGKGTVHKRNPEGARVTIFSTPYGLTRVAPGQGGAATRYPLPPAAAFRF